jgi:hypothetical protein
VQAQDPPAPVLGDKSRAQLVAEAEGAYDLAVAGTGGPLTAGGPVERGDRVGGLRQRGEFIDVLTPELVLQESPGWRALSGDVGAVRPPPHNRRGPASGSLSPSSG